MNPDNTIILGNGYIGSAYGLNGYKTVSRAEFAYQVNNFQFLHKILEQYQYIVNCIGYTNTTLSEKEENFKEVWLTNVLFVKELSDYCNANNKKLIHISTTDLYGNLHDFNGNVETRRDLDIATNYRFSKYAGERMCSPNDLILRVCVPYDGRNHPKNLLVKVQKFTKFYQYIRDFTYLPDLVKATEVICDEKGIFNIVTHEADSVIHLLKDILMLPSVQHINIDDENDPNIIREPSVLHVHNTSNDLKLYEFFKQENLYSSMILAYNQLNHE